MTEDLACDGKSNHHEQAVDGDGSGPSCALLRQFVPSMAPQLPGVMLHTSAVPGSSEVTDPGAQLLGIPFFYRLLVLATLDTIRISNPRN